jgi:hypothetical protein
VQERSTVQRESRKSVAVAGGIAVGATGGDQSAIVTAKHLMINRLGFVRSNFAPSENWRLPYQVLRAALTQAVQSGIAVPPRSPSLRLCAKL